MNYTETYNKIYNIFKEQGITHTKAHSASIRITDSLNDIYTYTKRQAPNAMFDIATAVEQFSNVMKNTSYIHKVK